MADDNNQSDRLDRFIPPEILCEILKRLPVKSLGRFKCVSTLWCSIISDRGFMSSQWSHSRSHPHLLAVIPCHVLNLNHPSSSRACFNFCPDHDGGQALQMNPETFMYDCNDLYCKHRSVGGLVCLASGDTIKICNPSTRESVALPDTAAQEWISLCFDPVTNEHKVLLELSIDYHLSQGNYVFAPGSSSWRWRRLQDSSPGKRFDEGDEVCINGTLYYIVREGSGQFLVKFDVHSERFQMVPVDLIRLRGDSHILPSRLVEYMNRQVAMVEYPRCDGSVTADHLKERVRLWVLDEAREDWSLKKTLMLPSRTILPRDGVFSLSAGSIHAGEDLVFIWTSNMDSFCLMYNNKSGMFTNGLTKLQVPSRYPQYVPMLDRLTLEDHEDNLLALEAFKPALN